jgi:hypothetical protein
MPVKPRQCPVSHNNDTSKAENQSNFYCLTSLILYQTKIKQYQGKHETEITELINRNCTIFVLEHIATLAENKIRNGPERRAGFLPQRS